MRRVDSLTGWPLAMRCVLLAIIIFCGTAAIAKAAPLKVQASYMSPYYSRTVETLVTVNLKAKKAGTATITARGLQLPNYAGGQRDDEYQATVRLHKGRNHFRRRFFVARWVYAIPGYGAALHPYHDRFVAEWLNAVSVVLEAGSRRAIAVTCVQQINGAAACDRSAPGQREVESR